MIFEILASGPSIQNLKESDLEQNRGKRIAVNQSVRLDIICDYWIFKDQFTFLDIHRELDYRPTAVVSKAWMDQKIWEMEHKELHKAKEAFVEWPKETFPIDNTTWNTRLEWGHQNNKARWCYTSFFSAVGFACLKGAQEIRIYGNDMSGANQFTEHEHERAYWQRVERCWESLKGVVQEHGIKIHEPGDFN